MIRHVRLLEWCRLVATVAALVLALAGVAGGWGISAVAVAIVFTVAHFVAELRAGRAERKRVQA